MLKNIPLHIFLLCSLFFTGVASAQALRSSYSPIRANVPLEAELLLKTNEARTSEGIGSLQQDEQLALAARQHALEMATLNYFSHDSPNAVNATASKRVARAGSPLVSIGENIAKVGENNVATVTTQGWLDSPGHRKNLLHPKFTHVGFGTTQDRNGQIIVVQVLAYQPVKLRQATVGSKAQNSYDITLQVSLSEDKEALFTFGENNSEPMNLVAGTQEITLSSLETGQIHIRGAVRATTGGGFIIEDTGWLTLATGNYRADGNAPKNYMQILDASSALRSGYIYDVEILLDNTGSQTLALFVDNEYRPEAEAAPGVFRVSIPTTTARPEIAVGQVTGGNQVEIVMMFAVDTTYGKPQLTPRVF
mgnify:CR=1 FL=1